MNLSLQIVVNEQGDTHNFDLGELTTVGRKSFNNLQVNEAYMSAQHAKITRAEDGTFHLQDLGSKNGTFLNGEAVEAPTAISDGDTLRFGLAACRVVPTVPTAGDDLSDVALSVPPPIPAEPISAQTLADSATDSSVDRDSVAPIDWSVADKSSPSDSSSGVGLPTALAAGAVALGGAAAVGAVALASAGADAASSTIAAVTSEPAADAKPVAWNFDDDYEPGFVNAPKPKKKEISEPTPIKRRGYLAERFRDLGKPKVRFYDPFTARA